MAATTRTTIAIIYNAQQGLALIGPSGFSPSTARRMTCMYF
jgi:hypothetical protein